MLATIFSLVLLMKHLRPGLFIVVNGENMGHTGRRRLGRWRRFINRGA
jgi:hypothetical protein